jgi:hypothetical protein
MASWAKVVLNSSKSHSHGGRTFIQGQPQLVTNLNEIEYYKGEFGFSVTHLVSPNLKEKEVVEKEAEAESKKPKRIYKRSDLDAKKKLKLIDIAARFDIPLTGSENKTEVIDAIMLAQGKNVEDDDNDESDE